GPPRARNLPRQIARACRVSVGEQPHSVALVPSRSSMLNLSYPVSADSQLIRHLPNYPDACRHVSTTTLLVAITLRPTYDPQLRFTSLVIRHIDQAGKPADQGVLIGARDAIRIRHFPQHLDDADTFLVAKILDYNPAEMKQVRRPDCTFF